jgi:hypothetical protein
VFDCCFSRPFDKPELRQAMTPRKGNNILDSEPTRLLHFEHEGASAIPSFVRGAIVDMQVPGNARRSVIFIGEYTGGKFMPRATGFLIASGDEVGKPIHFSYLVTAEHVLVGMAHKQKEIFARYNLKDGTARVESIHSAKWWYHPTDAEKTDVAITAISFDWNIVDHEAIPLYNYDPTAQLPIFRTLMADPSRNFRRRDICNRSIPQPLRHTTQHANSKNRQYRGNAGGANQNEPRRGIRGRVSRRDAVDSRVKRLTRIRKSTGNPSWYFSKSRSANDAGS